MIWGGRVSYWDTTVAWQLVCSRNPVPRRLLCELCVTLLCPPGEVGKDGKPSKDKKKAESKSTAAPAPAKPVSRRPPPRQIPEPKKVVNSYLADMDLPSSESESDEEGPRRRGVDENDAEDRLEEAVRVRVRCHWGVISASLQDLMLPFLVAWNAAEGSGRRRSGWMTSLQLALKLQCGWRAWCFHRMMAWRCLTPVIICPSSPEAILSSPPLNIPHSRLPRSSAS